MKKGCIYQLCSSQSILYSKDKFITTEDYHGGFLCQWWGIFWFCLKDNYEVKVNDILFPLKTYSNLLYCLLYSFPEKLHGCCSKCHGLNWDRRNCGNQLQMSNYSQNCTETSPVFLIADQTEFPFFLKTNIAKYLHMGDEAKRSPHVLKCFAGSGPERLANLCLLRWFHAKCPYVYRELFFPECLKTVLHYKLYRKKLLQTVLQYICGVVCCSG